MTGRATEDRALRWFDPVPVAAGRARTVDHELHSPFRISRGSTERVHAVVVELEDGEGRVGRGESSPYGRYGEQADGVRAQCEEVLARELRGRTCDPWLLHAVLAHGAARNALDAALWDLACKRLGRRAFEIAGVTMPSGGVQSVDTVVLDTPDAMRDAAAARRHLPILKLKLDREAVVERVEAVRTGAPRARLVVDANEAWDRALLDRLAAPLARLGVELIEQPLPAGDDAALEGHDGPVPLCADESCHTRADLARLRGRYTFVNIKLDKAGGPSEALALFDAARAAGFGVMVGCMVSSSLAIAPATMVAAKGAAFADLDGPTWLADERGRDSCLVDERLVARAPTPELWG